MSDKSKVKAEQVEEAVKALFVVLKKKDDNMDDSDKLSLFSENDDVSLIISLKKTPDKARTKPHRVQIPHSLNSDASICVFTKDPQKDYKELLAKVPVAGVDKVIGVSKLRKNYRQYADKRKLLQSYDVFLADDRIVPLLPPLLGSKFFQKKKHPTPVNFQKSDLAAELEKALNSTNFYISAGSCCLVRIAKTSFTRKQVIANIVEGLPSIVSYIPGKWKNVQSIHLKTQDSIAMPLFNSLPVSNRINITGMVKAKTVPLPPAITDATQPKAAVQKKAVSKKTKAQAKSMKGKGTAKKTGGKKRKAMSAKPSNKKKKKTA